MGQALLVLNHRVITEFLFCSFLSVLQSNNRVMAVAIVSETGMAIHIPFKAYIRGKISSNGIRNMTCRVKLRKMDLEAIPKDWNRLVVTIWNPTSGNTPITMRIPCMATSMRFVSVVKARIM